MFALSCLLVPEKIGIWLFDLYSGNDYEIWCVVFRGSVDHPPFGNWYFEIVVSPNIMSRFLTWHPLSCACAHIVVWLCVQDKVHGNASSSTGTSPTKSIATGSYLSIKLGRAIHWNIGPFETGTMICKKQKLTYIKFLSSMLSVEHFLLTKLSSLISELPDCHVTGVRSPMVPSSLLAQQWTPLKL